MQAHIDRINHSCQHLKIGKSNMQPTATANVTPCVNIKIIGQIGTLF